MKSTNPWINHECAFCYSSDVKYALSPNLIVHDRDLKRPPRFSLIFTAENMDAFKEVCLMIIEIICSSFYVFLV